MKKILLSLLLASGVNNSFAMQAGGGSAQGGAAGSATADTVDDNLSPVYKALFCAVRSGDLESVRAQIAEGANVNVQNSRGGTALMYAAHLGHVKVVRALLAGGADVNAQSSQGVTALMDAARYGHVEVVRALIAGGANVNAQDSKRFTALMIAAQNGHAEVVRQLIVGGANVNAQVSGWTALMFAAQNGHAEVVRALIAGGADRVIFALLIAAKKGHVGVVQAVLANSADVNAQSLQGMRALMLAAYHGHVGVVQALLHAGADVNARNSINATALMLAVEKGHADFAKALIAGGADANAQNTDGATALMIAAKKGHVEVVRALLHAGADVNVKSSENKTAIDYASGKPEIIALLQAHKDSQAAQAASAQPVPSKAAAAKGKGKAAAGGGVARAGGGAASQPAVNPKLCIAVAAKILKDADTQTDELVQIPLSRAQKRLASSLGSESGSAFSRPEKETSAEQPSFEIMIPVARHSQVCDLPSMQHAMTWSQPIFALAGTQPAMAMAVAPQIPLQNLITLARRNGTGLFGLIELLNNSAPLANFDAHQAALLFTFMGFDATVFAQANYAPITGFNLADLLSQNIITLCGQADPEIGLTAEQDALIDVLNQRFALYAQHFGN